MDVPLVYKANSKEQMSVGQYKEQGGVINAWIYNLRA